jgi:hypothetical protein
MHRKKSLWEAISSPANFPNYDARTGLGYGTQSGFHASREYPGTFPYLEPSEDLDDVEDVEFEREDAEEFRNKLGGAPYKEPYSSRKTDPFYYYGSATPSGMFGEAVGPNRTRGSISPLPGLYKGKEAVSGGGYVGASVRPFQVIIHNRSTPHGWNKSIHPIEEPVSDEEDDTEPIDILRKVIRKYHIANMSRE